MTIDCLADCSDRLVGCFNRSDDRVSMRWAASDRSYAAVIAPEAGLVAEIEITAIGSS